MTGGRNPRDMEDRLRASLHAYADLVGAEPAPPTPVASPRAAVSRVPGWRAPVLVAAAVLAVAGGAWVVVDAASAPAPTAVSGADAAVPGADSRAESGAGTAPDSAAAAPESAAAAGVPASPGDLTAVPTPVEVGVSYPFDLSTHCGVLGADVGGLWFAAEPPLVDGSGNPPPGWDHPYQRGTLTLESVDEAVFRDGAGHELRLRSAGSERPPPCD